MFVFRMGAQAKPTINCHASQVDILPNRRGRGVNDFGRPPPHARPFDPAGEVAAMPIDFTLTKDQRDLQMSARAFAKGDLDPFRRDGRMRFDRRADAQIGKALQHVGADQGP